MNTIFKKTYLQLLIIILFAGLGSFTKLNQTELQPLGSSVHASVSREILRTGDWLTLHWPYCEEFKDFYQFPPLFFWLTAITYKIFGINDFAAKFVSSLFGFLVIILTYYLGKILINNYAGFLSSMTVILTPYFFRHSRKCELETILIFFITLSFIFFVIAEKNNKEKFVLLTGFSVGLGFLSKGPPAFCVWPAIILYYLLTKQYKKIFGIYLWSGILISIFVPMLWIIPQIIYKGDEFYQKYIINQIFWSLQGRSAITTDLISKIKGYTFYLTAFFSYYLPWSITGIFGVYKIIKQKFKTLYILILWVIIVWFGFTIAGYKDDYYLLAFWPGWSIINGFIFANWTYKIQNKLIFTFFIIFIIFAVSVTFTQLKFDKSRNPEIKILSQYINKYVPENERLITYNMFYYDMAGLILWYADRGVMPSKIPDPKISPDAKAWKCKSIDTQEELQTIISTTTPKYLLIKKDDFKNLNEKIKQKLFIITSEGRFIFAANIPERQSYNKKK